LREADPLRDRPTLTAPLAYVRAGDSVVVWKLDRLARSLKQLIETVELLAGPGIGLVSLTEEIDTTTAGGRLVFQIFRALAGLDAARARGKRAGCLPSLSAKDIQAAKAMLRGPSLTVEEIAVCLGCSPSTLYRRIPAARAEAAISDPPRE
jgi:DNA invertase Pin-like site-specific DNA recombinase